MGRTGLERVLAVLLRVAASPMMTTDARELRCRRV